jgi:transcription elongation GreA/GreB family factor
MLFKQKILQQFQEIINDRVDIFQDMISALTEDSKNDAKGSAGDKHETALSMMHIEQEKLNKKLSEILLQKAILDKIDVSQNTNKIAIGSLIQTNGMLLFMSTALPKIVIDEKTIIAVSPQSPLGNKLLGNEVGFEFEINGTKYNIEKIE